MAQFISTKTLVPEKSIPFELEDNLHYGQGLLVVDRDNTPIARILHVVSETYFQNLNTEGLGFYKHWRFSSKFLVVVSAINHVVKINIYYIEAKIPSLDPLIPLLVRVEVPRQTFEFIQPNGNNVNVQLDGTRLFIMEKGCGADMLILDFAEAPITRAYSKLRIENSE